LKIKIFFTDHCYHALSPLQYSFAAESYI